MQSKRIRRIIEEKEAKENFVEAKRRIENVDEQNKNKKRVSLIYTIETARVVAIAKHSTEAINQI